MYNFDKASSRKNTNSSKWDFIPKYFPAFNNKNKNIIPLWVADMDFEVAPEIQKAIVKTTTQKMYGYSEPSQKLSHTISNWAKTQYKWNIKPQHVTYTSATITGINFIIRALTKEQDTIIVHQPVYPPLYEVVQNTKRILNVHQLIPDKNLHYTIDFNLLDKDLKKAKMFILCNPQNPTGRAWTKAEIEKIVDLCYKHKVLIISDDVHADIIFDNAKYNNVYTIAKKKYPAFAQTIITLLSPNKTFNIAGIKISMMIIPNIKQQESIMKIQKAYLGSLILSPFAISAAEAAYSKCTKWKNELVTYLKENKKIVYNFFHNNYTDIICTNPESTYLLWIDFSQYIKNKKISYTQLQKILFEKAQVGLSAGHLFGKKGKNYMRLNFACQRSVLKKALNNIKKTL